MNHSKSKTAEIETVGIEEYHLGSRSGNLGCKELWI